jgi:hypothetical protein
MLTGSLKDFSLPELFQILAHRQKTGLLTISGTAQASRVSTHYLWLYQGRFVAADFPGSKGLSSLIDRQGWMSDRVVSKLTQVCSPDKPIGLCLKSQGLLQAEQLKWLFRARVLKQLCAVFELSQGEFSFDSEASLPMAEMTGLSISATEAVLVGLRALRNWTEYNLPEPTSAVTSAIQGKPHLRLDATEWQVWEFANGTVSLQAIAAQLQLPVLQVQQIAARLIAVGLAEEVALSPCSLMNEISDPSLLEMEAGKSSVNSWLVQSFIGLLLP